VTFDDQRTAIYSAKTGRLLAERPDPCKDPKVQAEINACQAGSDNPVRYAVVFPLAKTTSLFFDFSVGHWQTNPNLPGVAFKDRGVAEAAARVLTKQRRKNGRKSVILRGGSSALQTVAFRRSPRGVVFLEKVSNGLQSFIPRLPRHIRAQITSVPD
jgi:hypothetical protein